MDIDKLIERLWNYSVYNNALSNLRTIRDAATALSTLQTENEKLRDELEQVKREKDAAASDLESVMAYRGDNLDTCQFCKNGQCHVRGGTKQCLPQWRGPKEG